MKILLKAIVILIALILLLVGVAAVFVWNFDPNDHKKEIVAEVKARTGRELKLEGDLRLSLYPWLGLEADGVTLGNAPGFGDEPFLRAEHLQVRAKLLSLLGKTVEMDVIRLEGGELHLMRNSAGGNNWDDLVEGGKEGKAEPLKLAALAIGGVDIKNARFSWSDQAKGQTVRLAELSVATGPLTMGEPIQLAAATNIEANKPAITGALTVDGTLAYNLDAGRFAVKPFAFSGRFKGKNLPGGAADLQFAAAADVDLKAATVTVANLNLATLGARLEGAVKASKIKSAAPAVTADLVAHGADLGLILRALEIEPLASQLARVAEQSFELSAKLDGDVNAGALRVSELSAKLLGATVTGRFQGADMGSKAPLLSGEVAAHGPDLPALLLVLGQFETGKEPRLKSISERLGHSSSKAFELHSRFDADLKSGRIDVSELTASALGIRAKGSLKAVGDTVDGELDVHGTKPADLLTAFGQKQLAEVLLGISAQARLSGNLHDLTIQPFAVTARFAGTQIPGGPADVVLNSAVKANLDDGTLTFSDLKMAGLGLDVAGELNATRITTDRVGFEGALRVAPFNLRQFLIQINQKLPPMSDNGVLQKVAVNAKLTGSTDNIVAKELSVLLDDTHLKGEVAVNHFQNPDVNFAMTLDGINADRYLPPRQKGDKPEGVTPEAAAAAAAMLPVEQLRALRFKGDLAIGRLVISNLKLNNVKLAVRAREGKILASPLAADLYQGTYQGTIGIDATGKVAKLSVDSRFRDIQAEPLLIDLHGKSRLQGRGDLTAQLEAMGGNAARLKRSLTGQAKLAVKDGAIKGVNIGKLLRSLEGGVVAVSEGESTDFTELGATVVCNNGLCQNQDLLIKSPLLRVGGSGTLVDLATDRVDYTLQANLVKTAAGQGGPESEKLKGVTIPIKISGTVSDPKFKPDFGEIAKSQLQRQIEKQIEKRLGKEKSGSGDAKDAVKDALKKMLKF